MNLSVAVKSIFLYITLIYGFLYSLPAISQQLASTIGMGSQTYPTGLAVDSTRKLLYVSLNNTNAVAVVNLTTNAVVKSIVVGKNPTAVAVNLSTGLAYVANNQGSSISIINPGANYAVTTVNVFQYPYDISVNPVNGKVYIAHYSSTARVSVIDPSKNNAITTITPGATYQWKVAVNTKNGMVYTSGANGIGCNCTSYVTAIDPATNAATNISVGQLPAGIVVDANTSNVYVSTSVKSVIYVIAASNGNTVTQVAFSGNGAGAIALDSVGRLFITPYNSLAQVTMIDPGNGFAVRTIPLNAVPGYIGFDSKINVLVMSVQPASNSGALTFLDPASLVQGTTIQLSGPAYSAVTNGSLGQTYVIEDTNMDADVVTD